MRVIALLATYNEERFVTACLENLIEQGVEVYLIDNCSTDQTVAIAEGYLHRGLIGIETLARDGLFSLRPQLRRKEELAVALDADWFLHVDADEMHRPPRSDLSLPRALAEVEALGYNAVNFLEFCFIPTREAPNHDHADFQQTMRSYYPYQPRWPGRLAWKRQDHRVELAWSGGRSLRLDSRKLYPEWFPMRHYLYLSLEHAVAKYVARHLDPIEVAHGWHDLRPGAEPDIGKLPGEADLRTYTSDDELDASNPRTDRYLALYAPPATSAPRVGSNLSWPAR
jgi:glycosyltransferase involved in cell wall biosynthesis